MKIALIHALKHSPPPIEAAFQLVWPQATLLNIMDETLSEDLARDGTLTADMTARFLSHGRQAAMAGVDGILFTCSAFGPCIEAVAADLAPLPVLKPNEAMIEEAVQTGGKIGLLATFAPTLASMPREFPSGADIVLRLAEGALAALDEGDGEKHDLIAAVAARDLARCDVIVLAQFSLARAARAVTRTTGLPVLTAPDTAVVKLKRLLIPTNQDPKPMFSNS